MQRDIDAPADDLRDDAANADRAAARTADPKKKRVLAEIAKRTEPKQSTSRMMSLEWLSF
jgi:hypothetical protein